MTDPRHDGSISDIVINGKFLRARMTGVHRVAFELCNALADLSTQSHPHITGRRFEVWRSTSGATAAEGIRLPVREVTPLDGIPWEQFTLPIRARGHLLLNFCNIAPALAHDSITMIHDAQVFIAPQSYSLPFRAWYKTLLPLAGRRGRTVLTVSNFSRGEISNAGIAPIERIHAVYNGVDHVLREPGEPAVVGRLGLTPGTYVLALANTQAHKNIGVLLEAFADPLLADKRLVLFGSAGRQAFVDLGHTVPGNVLFAGHVSDSELRSLMEAAVVLGFPSRTEGFGLPPLESMLLGTPAICAPCGALPEVCGDAALYADPETPADWVQAILKTTQLSEFRADLVRRGQDRAARFTWRRAAERLLNVIDAVSGTASASVELDDRV